MTRRYRPNDFDVWYYQKPDPDLGRPGDHDYGTIPGQAVEDLLWHFTYPGDTVLDPMAGAGVTIDACKRHNRVCYAFDIKPHPDRKDIPINDIMKGLPENTPKAHLAILDPPYYTMKVRDAYSSLEAYLEFLRVSIDETVKGLVPGGHIAVFNMDQAFSIENERLPPEDLCHIPLVLHTGIILMNHPDLKARFMVSAPDTTQCGTGDQVLYARRNKYLLGRNRICFVFKKKGVIQRHRFLQPDNTFDLSTKKPTLGVFE